MRLESIEVQHFRNLCGKLTCVEGLNILAGENGQGKTNWLEAIGVLASARSFRTAKLQEIINFDSDFAWVRGAVRESPEILRELRVEIKGNTKTLSINDIKNRQLAISASFTQSFSIPTNLRSSAACLTREDVFLM